MFFEDVFREAGVFEYGAVATSDVDFTEEVRKYCEENTCRKYKATWACPPAIGTVDECRARARGFSHIMVFSAKYDIEDSLDYDGMVRGMTEFRTVADKVDDGLKPYLDNYIVLGNEGCGKCMECTYPDSPCRVPDKVHGSIEGYGVYVFKLAKQAGVRYNNGTSTVTYFGAVLYNESERGMTCD